MSVKEFSVRHHALAENGMCTGNDHLVYIYTIYSSSVSSTGYYGDHPIHYTVIIAQTRMIVLNDI